MGRTPILILAAICVFVAVAAILLAIMPSPLRSIDYLVVGSVATLVALLILFAVVVSTSPAKNVFFSRRKRK